ncbi:hypothetical protein GCM10023214_73300 [Amycolatopsis dongchuanensis]|uniref:Uncharacterized protein n=1 Tax=Amycolatopsis dongchuanensis TaxID=1070866 RepID=A0ABP8VPN7_9PSEU
MTSGGADVGRVTVRAAAGCVMAGVRVSGGAGVGPRDEGDGAVVGRVMAGVRVFGGAGIGRVTRGMERLWAA